MRGEVELQIVLLFVWAWTVVSALLQKRFSWRGLLASVLALGLLASEYAGPEALASFFPWILFLSVENRERMRPRLIFYYLTLVLFRFLFRSDWVFGEALALAVLVMLFWSLAGWWTRTLLVWTMFGFAVRFSTLETPAYYLIVPALIGTISLVYYLLGKGRLWAWLVISSFLSTFALDGNPTSLLPMFAIPWILTEFSGADNLRIPIARPISFLVKAFVWGGLFFLGGRAFSVPMQDWLGLFLVMLVLVLIAPEVIFDLAVNLHKVFGGILRKWSGYETYINHRWISLEVSFWGEVMAVVRDYAEGLLSIVKAMRWGWVRAIVGLITLLWGLVWLKG